MELSTIQTQLKIQYYTSLILQLKKNKSDTKHIEKLLNNINDTIIESETTTILNTDTDIKSEDDYIYKKEWNKLNNIHKIIKIKEYVNNLSINSTEKDVLKNTFINFVKNKKITKKSSVVYDIINCRIINIPCLEFKNGKYTIKT
jgi:hypothetical protein